MTQKQKYEEVPGNAVASAANWARYIEKIAEPVLRFQASFEGGKFTDFEIKAIRFKAPVYERGEWLCVVSVSSEAGSFVGFHKDVDFASCLTGTLNRIQNRSMQWKVDEYAK